MRLPRPRCLRRCVASVRQCTDKLASAVDARRLPPGPHFQSCTMHPFLIHQLLNRQHWRLSSPALAVAAALALVACASTPPPVTPMALAQAAVASAVAAGGVQYAPAETALARDKLARAQTALAAKDNDQALLLAEQVQVDARLAEARTEAEKARRSAAALQEATRALREEMARQPR